MYLKPAPLGFAGTVYKLKPSVKQEALVDLGTTKHQSLSVFHKLHMHAMTCLHDIMKKREILKLLKDVQEMERPASAPYVKASYVLLRMQLQDFGCQAAAHEL